MHLRLGNPLVRRALGAPAKAIIRNLIYWYLDRRNLTITEAETWATRLKRYPALFQENPYRKKVDIGFGVCLEAGLIDVIQRNLIVEKCWDPRVLKYLNKYLKRGFAFIDIGANIGYFTLIASQLVGDEGLVVAVEPSCRALSELSSNIQINQLKNVIILSIAGGNDYSINKLTQATPNNIGASTLSSHVAPFAFETVPVVPLDSLILLLGLIPDLIKIDAEGFEYQVLLGLKQVLELHRPKVICELTEEWLEVNGGNASEILDYMHRLGYKAFIIGDSEPFALSALEHGESLELKLQEEILFV